MQVIIVVLLVRLAIFVLPSASNWLQLKWKKLLASFRKAKQNELFDQYFIEPKNYYLKEFRCLPNIAFIGNIDAGKIFKIVESNKYGKVEDVYQRNYYNWQQERVEFSKTIFKLSNKIVVKIDDDWAEILYNNKAYQTALNMLNEFKENKALEKEEDYEINIITYYQGSLDLKSLAIKPTDLNLNLYYNDDFLAVDETIKQRLAKDNDKGIVLLHGLPGTGKTTYLRHLIGAVKKKVMFVSPSVASNLMNPEFMDLLLDNPNAILVIEDAENIIMDRRYNSNSSVSNLLNISDGLLSDCLNVQIICTFNSDINLIDSALLRKGRLIAKYEFGKLNVEKAQALSDYLSLNQQITKPMTLAEITNPNSTHFELKPKQVIGFRRMETILEN